MGVALTNPKAILFFSALFPQFIVPHQPQVMQYLVLGVTTIVVDIIVMIGYATLAQRIAAWISLYRAAGGGWSPDQTTPDGAA